MDSNGHLYFIEAMWLVIDDLENHIADNLLCFLVAEGCLIAGSARNAYHTKYIGYYEKKDLTSCIALRKGVFAAAAAFALFSLASSLSFYWSYSRADAVGWVKHQNEGGIGMAEYGQDKSELRSSNI
ncbi:hypothetical protein IEQ34_021003 [Dendrobium chrysotoxum]|uniref:CASP-like protein n=1 Tax=Dendrobium chrysotoxum TaxID=161865 RepID=A0AAV7G1X8_DENCH|nr:hypothetical protein IEQ34_021003 [Dendrobium chrysotoxum]